MSNERKIQEENETLLEIQSIMAAMKNISLVEFMKVKRFIECQKEVSDISRNALEEVLRSFPYLRQRTQEARRLNQYIVIGSERGFCGGFNKRVLEAYKKIRANSSKDSSAQGYARSLFIGQKLGLLVEQDQSVDGHIIEGAQSSEDISNVALLALENALKFSLSDEVDTLSNWVILYHSEEGEKGHEVLCFEPLEILFHIGDEPPGQLASYNMDPLELLEKIFEFVFIQTLHTSLNRSFFSESRARIRHMDQALRNLDKKIKGNSLLQNALRQEQITEEIEIIQLNSFGKSKN